MMMFMAGMLEQLDLALEQVSKPDAHYARFAIMLTDNVVELYLHQIAQDEAFHDRLRHRAGDVHPEKALLDKALGQSFEDKLRFARVLKGLDDRLAQTVAIMHGYRNEVYHVGVQHERILPSLATFYLAVACEVVGRYEPLFWGWASTDNLPDRSKKYLEPLQLLPDDETGMFEGGPSKFKRGCEAIAAACRHDPLATIAALADYMDDVVEGQDECLNIVARGVYKGQERTRDEVVIECQAWGLARSEKGKAFLVAKGWAGGVLGRVGYLAKHYPFKLRTDPIGSWRRQAARLRARTDPHAALGYYQSFMSATAALRELLDEAATAVDAESERAYDA